MHLHFVTLWKVPIDPLLTPQLTGQFCLPGFVSLDMENPHIDPLLSPQLCVWVVGGGEVAFEWAVMVSLWIS